MEYIAAEYIFNIIHIPSWDSDELSTVTVSLMSLR